jgi:hypothetical protein
MTTLPASARALLLTSAAFLACGAAWAQAATTTGCDPRQDPAACARESGAARQEAARGGLTRPGAAADQNATARCQALPANEQADCLARMQGSATGAGTSTTTTSGSVMGGGVIRETVTTVPVPAPAPSR